MGNKKKVKALMNQESFRREVVRTEAVSSFESDAGKFADTLWPMVRRLAESAFYEGQATGAGTKNPYKS